MSVKRLRWEQVENSEGTIWGQVSSDRLFSGVARRSHNKHDSSRKKAVNLPSLAAAFLPPTTEDKASSVSHESQQHQTNRNGGR